MANPTIFFVTVVFVAGLRAVASDVENLSPKEEIEKIRALARMIRQTDNPSELTVHNLLTWLQGKYDAQTAASRRTRQQHLSREYLPATSRPTGVDVPRPFKKPEGPYPDYSDQPFYDDLRQKEEQDGNGVPGVDAFDRADTSDDSHPPHIHDIRVQCAKDMMMITIEFNRVFNGVIYSKGFYSSEKCRYVRENSGQTTYTFSVSLDSCGTQFVDRFADGGQAYLENVLVMQNEPGIQEVWDTVRMVRCLWEGSIKKDLSVSLVIGMLTQEVVTFSGDTGGARLDIQVGRGPFAQPANGLVKIGENMTLVVYVEGDTGFDVVVRNCQARDEAGVNSIQLYDDRGCVLKPKLFGAFQKTKDTGNTGASLIAYAYFSAFKFPDEMNLVIECSVELCKTDCDMCPENQSFEPGKRRKRDVRVNETVGESGNRVSGRFRVVSEDEFIELANRQALVIGKADGICMSTQGFLLSSLLILLLLVSSSITTAVLWLKLQKVPSSKV